jgi:hypothetical protein
MRCLIFVISVFLLISCKSLIKNQNQQEKYKVYKIETLDFFNTVYCERDGQKYKIVSKKTKDNLFNEKEKIKIEQSYNFVLDLYSPDDNSNNPLTNTTTAPYVIHCYMFESTKICEEDKVKLYTTKNLKGLYYVE